MSYRYTQNPPQGQYQSQYHQPPYQATYDEGLQNGDNPLPSEQMQASWGNSGYESYAGGPVQQSYPTSSSRSASYQQHYQLPPDSRPLTSYNPQEYAQPPAQYNPQAYSSPTPDTSHSTSRQSYNPADYANTYSQAPSPYLQQSYGYSPDANSSSTFPSPQQANYGQFSPPAAQQHFASTQPQPTSQYNYAYQSLMTLQEAPSPSFRQPSYPIPSSYAPPAVYETQNTQHRWPSPETTRDTSSGRQYPDMDHISPSALPGLAPDELNLPTPPIHSSHGNSPFFQNIRAERPSISPVTPQGPAPPAHAPQRSNTQRHPQLRPLPGPPEPDLEPDYFLQRPNPSGLRDDYTTEKEAQDDLFSQVENAVLNPGRTSSTRRHSPRIQLNNSTDSVDSPQPLFSPRIGTHRRNGSMANDRLSPEPPQTAGAINDFSDESDAEALAGLEAMRMAEEQDAADEARRQSGTNGTFGSSFGSQRQSQQSYTEVDEDLGGVDLSGLSGANDFHLSYGGDPVALPAGRETNGAGPYDQPVSSSDSYRRSRASSNHGSLLEYSSSTRYALPLTARVDAGGTGGLAEPNSGRRQSYDEGDEYSLMDDGGPVGEPPDLFFHPEPSAHRPLPPPPLAMDDSVPQPNTHWRGSSFSGQPSYPSAPDGYVQSTTDPNIMVPRSASLISHSNTTQIIQPIRSKTDAEERRLRQGGYRGSVYSTFNSTPSTSNMAIDLPSLPTKRFNPAKLGGADFKKCDEPWALSSILRWLLQVADPEKMTELRESMIKEALVALFTNKVATMNIADAEQLSNRVVEDMYAAGTLAKTEEWVKLRSGRMSGVIFQLTQSGCYSPKVHNYIIPGRCYAHHCQRTLKKVSLLGIPPRVTEDWATFYKLKKEDVEGVEKKEIELQNNLHEVVQSEEAYMEHLDVLIKLYRDPLTTANPSIISSKRLDRFIRDVFGKLEGVKRANIDHLLPQLKYRQEEQGPWIKGFSDIFRQWIRKARIAYVDYAAGFPGASLHIRQELERNIDFRTFVDKARTNRLSNKLGWDNYLKAPITRLQRYSLLLAVAHKNMKQDCEEKTNLQTAIDEIKAVTLECDARVAEMQRKVDLGDLGQKLVLRPGMQNEVELNLNYLGRELIFRGDLQRAGGTRFNWLDCHALLFDHYLVLAKAVSIVEKNSGGKVEKYDVSRLPIPMDLLVLENTTEDAVVKSSYVRGITSITPVPSRTPTSPEPVKTGRIGSTLTQTSTNSSNFMANLTPVSSSGKMVNTTVLEGPKDSEKIMYPFRIKHLGNKEPYTLFASTAANRTEWCTKIIEAKTKHAASLYAQNAEPFRLRVMADSAFYYDTFTSGTKDSLGVSGGGKPMVIKGTPLDRAIKEVELRFRDTGRPSPICRARVNCATSFTTPYPGKHMIAVGTDYGVYISEIDNPRGWARAITTAKVTQLAVLEEFNLFLLLADKSLIAYHLDAVTGPGGVTGSNNTDPGSARKAPQKLSGSRDVGFFSVGRMKDRTLVFYKKRDGVSSTFKVLEPVFQKSTEKKRGIFKRGTTEFFRDYDDFYVGTECTGINLFQSSLAVSTDKGFEVLTLDKKQPWSVPDWRAPEVANIATHVDKQTTLGMLRLNEQEFLLCYEKCAVYVNKHGEVCRSVVMNFVARARSAALYGAYLILFDTDFIEIRNALNGRLKQIIAGRDVKCLDDGGGGTISGGSTNTGVVNGVVGYGAASRTVKVVMQHPELERTQVVVELVLNEGLKEQ